MIKTYNNLGTGKEKVRQNVMPRRTRRAKEGYCVDLYFSGVYTSVYNIFWNLVIIQLKYLFISNSLLTICIRPMHKLFV